MFQRSDAAQEKTDQKQDVKYNEGSNLSITRMNWMSIIGYVFVLKFAIKTRNTRISSILPSHYSLPVDAHDAHDAHEMDVYISLCMNWNEMFELSSHRNMLERNAFLKWP